MSYSQRPRAESQGFSNGRGFGMGGNGSGFNGAGQSANNRGDGAYNGKGQNGSVKNQYSGTVAKKRVGKDRNETNYYYNNMFDEYIEILCNSCPNSAFLGGFAGNPNAQNVATRGRVFQRKPISLLKFNISDEFTYFVSS